MEDKGLRLLELYAGVGGMRTAAKDIGLKIESTVAYEINPSALEAYNKNFNAKCKPKNLLGLSLEDWDRLRPDIVTMSPPCQPFTRQGLQLGSSDSRCSSLHHILQIVEKTETLPSMILLENVKGFETSSTREDVTSVLKKRGYNIQEYLLSPRSLGVPNSRLRYYLLACREVDAPCDRSEQLSEVQLEFPHCLCLPWKQKNNLENKCSHCSRKIYCKSSSLLQKFYSPFLDLETLKQSADCNSYADIQCTLQDFLSDSLHENDLAEKYRVPDKILSKYSEILDIVDCSSTGTCCFTKAYGRLAGGTGSVYNPSGKEKLDSVFLTADTGNRIDGKISNDDLMLIKSLQLRYFSPREALTLMCYPSDFTFPESFTIRQQYQLVGNSINVLVVALLLDALETTFLEST